MFFRENFVPEWNLALQTKTDKVESVDVPVKDERHYFVTSFDGKGFYLTRCFHSITIVRAVESKEIGVYHHFYIPFRESCDDYQCDDGSELYNGFYNNGGMGHYSGLEVYSDVNGALVKINRYYQGKKYASAYYGNGIGSKNIIRDILQVYIVAAYAVKRTNQIQTKAGGRLLCPRCGADLLESDDGIYYCPHCPWNELTSMDEEIDASYVYGEGGSGSGYDGPDFPENPHQPDPNTGGGYVGGDSGSGGGVMGQGDVPSNFIIAEEVSDIVSQIELLMLDCGVNAIVDALSDRTIYFMQRSGQIPLLSMTPLNTGNFRIYCNYSGLPRTHIILEELFHCLQSNNGDYDHDWFLNLEVEAKYATFLYMQKNGLRSEASYFSDTQWGIFLDYQQSPTEANYMRLVNLVRGLSTEDEVMSEDSTHRDMRNLGTIFDCSNSLVED